MSAISGDWLEALKGEFHQPYYAKLYKTVMTEYQTRKIFPPADDLFNAFHFTPLNEVKVVILGQGNICSLLHPLWNALRKNILCCHPSGGFPV